MVMAEMLQHPPAVKEPQQQQQPQQNSAPENKEPETWGQMMKEYNRSKTKLPWEAKGLKAPQPVYVKTYDVSRKAREVDPVLMLHRDPAKEAAAREKEVKRQAHTIAQARKKQLLVEQKFNLINHQLQSKDEAQGKSAAETKLAAFIRRPDTNVRYNIINHVRTEDAAKVKTVYGSKAEEEEVEQCRRNLQAEEEMEIRKSKLMSHKAREADIISNRFIEDHEGKVASEKQEVQQHVEEAFWRTHDYDLLAGVFYNKEKEKQFRQTRRNLMKMQGRAQRHRLPPSIRYGEGQIYNIISKDIIDADKEGAYGGVGARGVVKKVKGREFFEQSVADRVRHAVMADQKCLNRTSEERYYENLRKGYNILSGISFTGREGEPPAKPRRPLGCSTVWSHLLQQGPENDTLSRASDGGGNRRKPRDLSGASADVGRMASDGCPYPASRGATAGQADGGGRRGGGSLGRGREEEAEEENGVCRCTWSARSGRSSTASAAPMRRGRATSAAVGDTRGVAAAAPPKVPALNLQPQQAPSSGSQTGVRTGGF